MSPSGRNHGSHEERIGPRETGYSGNGGWRRKEILKFGCCATRSEESREGTEVVSTGLDCEQSRESAGAGLEEVTCKGDPRAEAGDKVPVIVNSEKKS
jgi:hypothetical protein